MNFSDYQATVFRREGRVLFATFNRPETMNALDGPLQDDLDRLFNDAADDKESNVLVVTGAGRAFSAGGDMDDMQACIDNPDQFIRGTERGKKLVYSILDCPKPIIAKVNGPAIGLGATVALFCDVVIAAERAKIADPHVTVGLSAGDGGAIIWPALIGYARAKGFLFTGDAVTGAEAAAMGLINKAVPLEELDATVDAMAQRLAAGAAKAIQYTKLSVNIALKEHVQKVLDASMAWEVIVQRHPDHQEAVNAFREKRTPRFGGAE